MFQLETKSPSLVHEPMPRGSSVDSPLSQPPVGTILQVLHVSPVNLILTLS